MTDYVLAIFLSVTTALVLRSFGLCSFERVIGSLAQLVGGWRSDPWPRGVQEEDRDGPWGRLARAVADTPAIPELKPTVSKVRPIVHSR